MCPLLIPMQVAYWGDDTKTINIQLDRRKKKKPAQKVEIKYEEPRCMKHKYCDTHQCNKTLPL